MPEGASNRGFFRVLVDAEKQGFFVVEVAAVLIYWDACGVEDLCSVVSNFDRIRACIAKNPLCRAIRVQVRPRLKPQRVGRLGHEGREGDCGRSFCRFADRIITARILDNMTKETGGLCGIRMNCRNNRVQHQGDRSVTIIANEAFLAHTKAFLNGYTLHCISVDACQHVDYDVFTKATVFVVHYNKKVKNI